MKPTLSKRQQGNLTATAILLLIIFAIYAGISGCATAPEFEYQNTIELKGYIANEHNNPVIFKTDSTLHYVYDYQFDPQLVRVKRTILVKEQDGKLIFIAEKFEAKR